VPFMEETNAYKVLMGISHSKNLFHGPVGGLENNLKRILKK
jgi:hypothetical protein